MLRRSLLRKGTTEAIPRESFTAPRANVAVAAIRRRQCVAAAAADASPFHAASASLAAASPLQAHNTIAAAVLHVSAAVADAAVAVPLPEAEVCSTAGCAPTAALSSLCHSPGLDFYCKCVVDNTSMQTT